MRGKINYKIIHVGTYPWLRCATLYLFVRVTLLTGKELVNGITAS